MDTYKTLGSLLRIWFQAWREETEKVQYWSNICLFWQREERERPEIAPKSLILFSSSSVHRADCDFSPSVTEGLSPPEAVQLQKKRKNRCRVICILSFSSYILSTSLISFPQILAVWFTFLFMLFDFLTSVYPFVYIVSDINFSSCFVFVFCWKPSDSVCHWISTKV